MFHFHITDLGERYESVFSQEVNNRTDCFFSLGAATGLGEGNSDLITAAFRF